MRNNFYIQSLTVISIFLNHKSSTAGNIEHDLNVFNSCSREFKFVIWGDKTSSPNGLASVNWLRSSAHQYFLNITSQPYPTFPYTPWLLDFFICWSNTICSTLGFENHECCILPSDSDHFPRHKRTRI